MSNNTQDPAATQQGAMREGEALAFAWNVWSESEEGRECEEPTTLYAHPEARQYLRNRLWRAFMAGADAGRKIQ